MSETSESSISTKSQGQLSPWQVFTIFLRLGLTSFGGPIAHLGYFRNEFVTRRRWLTERSFADLVALCQFLPGPASSQVGISLGLSRAGYWGGIAAWAGFTLPSAVALILFAIGISNYSETIPKDLLHGLKIVAVAVVVQAVWGMATNLCKGVARITIMGVACCLALLFSSVWAQVGIIALAATLGLAILKPSQALPHEPLHLSISYKAGALWLVLFFSLLIGLPIVLQLIPNRTLSLVDAFYRAGSLVFGGGHVVLPLLQAETVSRGWINNEMFLAGYGATQAVPGPLFTFAAFLGASMPSEPSRWLGGVVCLFAIFAPSFLLIAGALPFWEGIRGSQWTQAALAGVNAAVVGILLAALYKHVWVNAIYQPKDFALALIALIALMFWKAPPWIVVLGSGLAGWLLGAVN